MKHFHLRYTLAFFLVLFLFSSGKSQIPSIPIKDTLGNELQLEEFFEDNRPILVNLWAYWCAPCIEEFTAWKELIPVWQSKYNVRIVCIDIDHELAHDKAVDLWNENEWLGEMYFAERNDLREYYNTNYIPQTYLYNEQGLIVYNHEGFIEGDEIELDNFIKGNFTVGIEDLEKPTQTFNFSQDQYSIKITSNQTFTDSQIRIVTLDGKLILSQALNNTNQAIEINKNDISIKNQIVVLEITNGGYRHTEMFHLF